MKRSLPFRVKNILTRARYVIMRPIATVLYPLTVNLPVIVSIETTSVCNAKCVMCPHSVMPRRNTRMEEKVFDAVVGQLGEMKVRLVILSLIGEPLLDDKLVERVRLLSNLGYKVRIVTNASLLTREVSQRLVAAGLSELYASLNGYDEKSHQNMMCFGTPQFTNCVENLAYFSEISGGRIKMHLNCLVRQPMLSEVKKKLTQSWKERGVEFNIMAPVKWHKAAVGKAGELYPCRVVFSDIVVDCYGNVLACCRDYVSKLVMGNVLKESLKEIWYGRAFNEFRLKHLRGAVANISLCSACDMNRSFNPVALLKSLAIRRGVR